MRIKNYRTYFVETLTPIYDAIEAESFFYLILEQQHQMKRIDLALQPESTFSEKQIDDWNVIVKQLQQEIPIQYILGKTSFYGLDFEVDENVLIPRPETEELVDWILMDCKTVRWQDGKIVDIGTGSGCIAISLAKNLPQAHVAAIDVSEKALNVAKKNAILNEVDVTFIHQNILETEDLKATFDIIVSNPPYVRNLEKTEIKNNVLAHEPHLALFVEDDDALLFYKKIAVLAQKNLKENGQLFFEINQYLGKEMIDLLSSMGFVEVELRQDIYGNDRMISATI
ncbi:peptide chain release factor N(5)-glutamine methyltransferase [Flavobacterium sp.]|uniref:peptide chain release factor N(5)-glutamine methyltransferase n=1 Tax=Flavobacterium sp. TaxID=239 RepID=UPI00286C69ED|nr:peptide chain release factor N(5)-glutamine methyltransferase [Flavobacterium sp.]